jgi:LmbE family N-acetylglucosaminyl deacetylase
MKNSSLDVFEYKGQFKRVLCVVAHPDDIDFGAAGTIACLTSHGCEVAYVMVTSGDAGGDDSKLSRRQRAAVREGEQRKAAQAVGVKAITFLGYRDGLVESNLKLRKEIAQKIRAFKPDLVITQNPERNWERIYASHPDHMAVGDATIKAVYPDARNPHSFPRLLRNGYMPHTVPEVWVTGSQPNFAVDITKYFKFKVAALSEHASQIGDASGLEERLKSWAISNAEAAGLKKNRLAETFRRIDTL